SIVVQLKSYSNSIAVWIDAHATIDTLVSSASRRAENVPLSFLPNEMGKLPSQTRGFETTTPI
ncbi:hypothetical protein TSMEX_009134, partial [Taenia solium]